MDLFRLIFLCHRKLRSYDIKNAPHGSHCGGDEDSAQAPAAGGESCIAGFFLVYITCMRYAAVCGGILLVIKFACSTLMNCPLLRFQRRIGLPLLLKIFVSSETVNLICLDGWPGIPVYRKPFRGSTRNTLVLVVTNSFCCRILIRKASV